MMATADAPSSAHEEATAAAVLTEELEAVVSTDIAAGDTLKVEAMAGSGKSTALRIYAERRPELLASLVRRGAGCRIRCLGFPPACPGCECGLCLRIPFLRLRTGNATVQTSVRAIRDGLPTI